VPPNFRRFLPFVLIAVFVLFLVPTLFRKKSSTTASAGTRAGQTLDAMTLIDKGEQAYLGTHGRYTPHLADLLTNRLAADLAIGMSVQIDVSTDGQRYLAQLESDTLSIVRGRQGASLIAQTCLARTSGVSCPAPPRKKSSG
jgi:hypothetical protein